MNTISSSVNKGAFKIAPKSGAIRRARSGNSVPGDHVEHMREAANLKVKHTEQEDAQRDSNRADTSISSSANTGVPSEIGTVAFQPSAPKIASDTLQAVALHSLENNSSLTDPAHDGLGAVARENETRIGSRKGESAHNVEKSAERTKRINLSRQNSLKPQSSLFTTKSSESVDQDISLTVPQGNDGVHQSDRHSPVSSDPSLQLALPQGDDGVHQSDSHLPDSSDLPLPLGRRRRESTPPEAEQQTFDPFETKMLELCRDTKRGRKSDKYTDFIRIKKERLKRNRAVPQTDQDHVLPPHIEHDSNGSDTNSRREQLKPSDNEFDMEQDMAEHFSTPSSAVGAPQVRVVNGEIVLDVKSLQIDRANRAENAAETMEYIEENPLERIVNSRTFSRHKASSRWSTAENELFYQGLSQWGTDFDMISRMFPQRSRRQIKNKYTVEERRNYSLVMQALTRIVPVNLDAYSKLAAVTYRPIQEMQSELQELKAQFELQRAEAVVATESHQADLLSEVKRSAPLHESKRAKRRILDEGLELVGSIEDVQRAEREEQLRQGGSHPEHHDSE